ncbi:hypothetical protein ACFYT3_04730 [Nocardia amikacinitolerans]|uniref:hypothetical protein n=1 Tax=Nocardia amikacinitolerans TaxID=756689 RepID=UPI0036AFC79D
MTEGWPSSISSFDDIFQRFFGAEARAGNLDPVVGRTVQKKLENKLSRPLLDGKLGSGDTVRVDADDEGLILGAIERRGEQTVEAGA